MHQTQELLELLNRARQVLDRYLIDEDDHMRDDISEVMMAIDDAVKPADNLVPIKQPAALARADEEVAA